MIFRHLQEHPWTIKRNQKNNWLEDIIIWRFKYTPFTQILKMSRSDRFFFGMKTIISNSCLYSQGNSLSDFGKAEVGRASVNSLTIAVLPLTKITVSLSHGVVLATNHWIYSVVIDVNLIFQFDFFAEDSSYDFGFRLNLVIR